MLYPPIKGLSNAQNAVQEGLAAAQRVFAVLDQDPGIKDRPEARQLPPLSRDIVYQGVSFSYGGDTVLQDLIFTVKKGEVLALGAGCRSPARSASRA